jgi:hypothetical protein
VSLGKLCDGPGWIWLIIITKSGITNKILFETQVFISCTGIYFNKYLLNKFLFVGQVFIIINTCWASFYCLAKFLSLFKGLTLISQNDKYLVIRHVQINNFTLIWLITNTFSPDFFGVFESRESKLQKLFLKSTSKYCQLKNNFWQNLSYTEAYHDNKMALSIMFRWL